MSRSLVQPGRRFLVAGLLAGLLTSFIGCGRQGTSTPPGAETTSPGEDNLAGVLAELTQLVRKYSVEQRQAPKSLDELVAKGYLASVPPAPKGKRFSIDKNLQVNLSDR